MQWRAVLLAALLASVACACAGRGSAGLARRAALAAGGRAGGGRGGDGGPRQEGADIFPSVSVLALVSAVVVALGPVCAGTRAARLAAGCLPPGGRRLPMRPLPPPAPAPIFLCALTDSAGAAPLQARDKVAEVDRTQVAVTQTDLPDNVEEFTVVVLRVEDDVDEAGKVRAARAPGPPD